MFISIEGADRTGKDTILNALDKATRWENCNMMRGPAGCLTYDKIYKRESDIRYNEALSVAETIKSTKHLIVYLYASPEVIQQRLDEEKKQGGSGVFAPIGWDIIDVLDLYEENINFLYGDEEVLKIDTGKYNVDNCVAMIKDRMNVIRNQDMQLIIDKNNKDIKSPNKGEFEYIQYLPYSHTFTKKELINKVFDRYVDKPYYDMLEASIEHMIYEYNLKWINDRQMIITSNDCIPFIQLKLNSNNIEWFVSQRSCDIEKHKLNDVLFFKYISYKLFCDIDFKIHYMCSFPHKYIRK